MAPSPPPASESDPAPAKQLSLLDVLCLGTNAIVGSGIYVFPGDLAARLGPASALAFGLCGLICCLIGLCFVETSGMFRRSGGPYIYAMEAFGPAPGFLVGWTCWAAALLSWAAVARAMSTHLGHLLPLLQGAAAEASLAIAVSLLLGGVNCLGVKPGAYTLDLLTVVKLIPLLLLLGLGLGALETARLSPFAPHGLGELPRAAFLAMFAFQGFEVVPVPAGETDRPRRNAPLALFGSLLLATLLYMALQIAAVGSTPGLAGSSEPLALMGAALLGDMGGRLVAGAAVVSMLGFCAGVALAGPRYLEALALDGHLPRALAARHPRFGTPSRSVLASALLTCLLLLLLDFDRLVDLAVLTVGFQYLTTALAVPALRRRRPDLERAFSLPLGPLIPICAAAVTVWFIAQAGAREALWFGVLLALGGAVWGGGRVAARLKA